MTKDDLFRLVLTISALSIHLIYIGIFLVIKRKDSLFLNAIVWSLSFKEIYYAPGK
jgi:hypothetical protein